MCVCLSELIIKAVFMYMYLSNTHFSLLNSSWGKCVLAGEQCKPDLFAPSHLHTDTQNRFPFASIYELEMAEEEFLTEILKNLLFCLCISGISKALSASVPEPKSLPFKQKRLLKRRQIESVLFARVRLCAA